MGIISGWHYDDRAEFVPSLLGKTLAKIDGATPGSDEIIFETATGERFGMYHMQDCCEGVSIEEVIGDVADLLGEPLLEVEEVSTEDDPPGYKPPEYRESHTWTFYKLRTRKGGVTLRWLGESNGYYSESVDFIVLDPQNRESGE